MNLHFAGSDGSEKYNEMLLRHGVQNRLESYHTLNKKSPSKGFNLLLDSGGFVARQKGKKISVVNLTNYINANGVTQAFELDTNDVKETLYNRDYMVANTKSYIIPVYHYSEFEINDKQYLFDMMDKFPYISIGGVAGRSLNEKQQNDYFKFVFSNTRDKVKVHGLGITALPTIKEYPFFSVDSTSWLSAARFGNFNCIRSNDHATFLRTQRHYLYTTEKEIVWWKNVQDYVTALWAEKGIVWKP